VLCAVTCVLLSQLQREAISNQSQPLNRDYSWCSVLLSMILLVVYLTRRVSWTKVNETILEIQFNECNMKDNAKGGKSCFEMERDAVCSHSHYVVKEYE